MFACRRVARGNLDPAMGRDRWPTPKAAWTLGRHANARVRAGNPSEMHWMLPWAASSGPA